MDKLTKHEEKVVKLALAGGTDKELAILEHIDELETKFDETVSRIEKSMPDLAEMSRNMRGVDGEKGDTGDQGEVGPMGPQGAQGRDGRDGIDGIDGRDGKEGLRGAQGLQGVQGIQGAQGDQGRDGSPDSPDQVIEKVNASSLQIHKERVEGLLDAISRSVANGVASVPVTTPVIFANGTQVGRAKNSNYIGATVKITGDTANITTSSGLTVTEIDGSPSVANPTSIKFSNGSVTDNGDGTVTVTTGAGGGGDFSSNTATSVDSEIVLFSGTGGKTGKRATGTGVATLTSGVLGTFNFADEELPTDSGDQTSFTLAHTPLSGTTKLYRGGARQQLGAGKDYTISGGTITLSSALLTGEILLIDYRY